MSRILTFDPGVTTGFVVWDSHQFLCGGHVQIDHLGKVRDLLDQYFVVPQSNDCVIIERVKAGSASFDQRAIEVMGVIKFLAREGGLPIILQPPHLMKGPEHWLGDRLKVISSPHIRDAVCHTLAHLKLLDREIDELSYEFDCNS